MSTLAVDQYDNSFLLTAFSEDDEDDENNHNGEDAAPEEPRTGASTSEEPTVKPEPGDDDLPAKQRPEKTPPHELHMYTVNELARFKKKELFGDVALLEGQ